MERPKWFSVRLSLGMTGSVQADGYVNREKWVYFFQGSQDNVVARYTKAMVLSVEEIDVNRRTGHSHLPLENGTTKV